MLYLANPCGEAVVEKMKELTLGYIDTPAQGNRRPPDVLWCADNGAFSNRFNEEHWWRFLEKNRPDAGTCLFAVAPDVVGDAKATLARSLPWLPKIRELGYPAAFVAQDGIGDTEIPWDEFDALFIGGTTEFKMGPEVPPLVAEAKRRGKHVHAGRVNSGKRYRYFRDLGCDTADGTFLTFGPTTNLPRLLKWFADEA